jgi:capsule biosynthesis phosphatase
MKKLRICIDLDGTICEIKKEGESYAHVLPKEGVVEKLRMLKDSGHTLIIHTARGMGTSQANEGTMMKNIGLITLQWLSRWEIPYDEIYFGKPNAHIMIDDRSLTFHTWDKISENLLLELAKDR